MLRPLTPISSVFTISWIQAFCVEGIGPMKNLDAVPFVPHVDPVVPHAVMELLPQYALCSQFPPTVWNCSMISLGGEVEGMYTYWLRREPDVAESVVLLPLK